MTSPLFDRVSPADLAERGYVYDFMVEIGRFPRLVEAVEREFGQLAGEGGPANWRDALASVRLEFGWADLEQRIPKVHGEIAAPVAALCQRCLEPFQLDVTAPVRLYFQSPGTTLSVPYGGGDDETWELEAERLQLADLVEELIIMALPLAPVHPSETMCGPLAAKTGAGSPQVTRPFADLRSALEKANN